jgi:S-adenosylmethionine decarboxylase proenzyme
MKVTLGTQWIVELYGCDETRLMRVPFVERALLTAAKKAGVKIVSYGFHQFEPHGVSGVVIIEESHISIHTWPEYQYSAVDFFYCSKTVSPNALVETLKKAFRAKKVEVQVVERGLQGEMVSFAVS